MTGFLADVETLVDLGFSVIPIGRNKRPRIPGETREERAWNPYRSAIADRKTLTEWFSPNEHEAFGIVCGALSGRRYGGHLVVLDLERRTDHEAMREIRDVDQETAVQLTPGGGAHTFVISRRPCRNLEVIDPTEPPDSPDHHVGDVKAEGGYVLAAPSVHPSGKRYKWINPLPTLLVVDDAAAFFRELLLPFGYTIRDRTETVDDETPARSAIAELLATECGEGQRHTTLVRIAGWCRNIMGLSEAESLCQAWNLACCKPPLGIIEVTETVEDIYARYQAPAEAVLEDEPVDVPVDRFQPIPLRDLLAMDLPPITWVVDGVIPIGSYTILSGPSGLGKSWLVAMLSIAVGHGVPFLGLETTPMRTLYIDEENAINLAQLRYRALVAGLEIDCPDETPLSLLVFSGFKLGHAPDINWLMRYIVDHKITLLVTDSWVRFFRGNENDSDAVGAMNGVIDTVRRRTGVTWIMLHHPRKSNPNNKGGDDGNDAVRGSGDIIAHADTHVTLRGAGADQPIIFKHGKSRWAEPIKDIAYRMEGSAKDGEPVRFVLLGDTAAALGADQAAMSGACDVLDMAGPLTVGDVVDALGRQGISRRTAERGIQLGRRTGAIVVDRKEGKFTYLTLGELPE